MTRSTPRKSSRERRKEILCSTLEILHQEGIQSLTLWKIGEKVGISEAAIFRHFGGKEEIMDTLASVVFDRSTVDTSLVNEMSRKEAILHFLRERVRCFKENPLITSLLFREDVFEAYPEIKARFTAFRGEVLGFLVNQVQEGISRGELDQELDPKTVALIVMGSLRSMVMDWRESGFDWDLDDAEVRMERHLSRLLEVR